MKGELSEIHKVEHFIKDETNVIEKVENQVYTIAKMESEIKENLGNVIFYLRNKNKIEDICNQGKKLSNNLIFEASKIHEIKTKALLNQPSENLFPIGKIFDKVNEARYEKNLPLFQKAEDLEKLFL